MSQPTVTLTFSIFDFGCLRGLIQREIENVERHARVVGVRCRAEDRDMTAAYLRQLRATLATVDQVYDGLGAT